MRIKIEDPAGVPALMAALASRVDAVVAQAAIDEIEVSLLGSRNVEADVAELERRIDELPFACRVLD